MIAVVHKIDTGTGNITEFACPKCKSMTQVYWAYRPTHFGEDPEPNGMGCRWCGYIGKEEEFIYTIK